MAVHKLQAYSEFKKALPILFLFKNKHIDLYKKNCEIFRHTATLLIHNLKYLSLVSFCFTTRKITDRVLTDHPADKGLRQC